MCCTINICIRKNIRTKLTRNIKSPSHLLSVKTKVRHSELGSAIEIEDIERYLSRMLPISHSITKGCDITMLNYVSCLCDADDRATGETKAYVTMLNLVCTINKI